jgi:nifR3 family TIM-barrel protein
VLALAPMQDVTDLAFWRLLVKFGGADVYFTEYFRVHADSRLDRPILDSILHNPTGRPVVAQMIGSDIPALVRTAKELQQHPVAAVDLNLGCPAPIVYKKCAGGGLLRDPDRIDAILGALRDALAIPFTVKTRIGFADAAEFDRILPLFAKHGIDLVTVHGRTVAEMYRSAVRIDLIARAAAELRCPVLANGNVSSVQDTAEMLRRTGARGVMIGRGAVRNPWIFAQIRQAQRGGDPELPSGRQVLDYVRELFDAVTSPQVSEALRVQKMKKYVNFLGAGVDDSGDFLHQIRRAVSRSEFFRICEDFLDHDRPMALAPAEPAAENPDAAVAIA